MRPSLHPISPDDSEPLELLRSIATLLHRAIEEYVAARVTLTDTNINGVVGEELKPRAQNDHPRVSEIIGQLLAAKEADGLSERYLQTLRSHLCRFGASFPGSVQTITASEIDNWLRAQRIGPRGVGRDREPIGRIAVPQGIIRPLNLRTFGKGNRAALRIFVVRAAVRVKTRTGLHTGFSEKWSVFPDAKSGFLLRIELL